MESPTEAAAADHSADPSAPTFSQVVFTDIPHSYPPSTPITARYTFNSTVQPNSRDWVGIFKVGWSTTKDYHTFVWVEPCQEVGGKQATSRQAVFKEYYLPRDEIEFYQFCYVDSTGQVRGASTPFCFRNPAEQNLEGSTEDDLLVITTQEQVEQGLRERAELQRDLDQTRAENQALRSSLLGAQRESEGLKKQSDQREAEQLRKLDQIRQDSENLKIKLQQQTKENDGLKEELAIQRRKQMEAQQQRNTEDERQTQSLNSHRKIEEKYDQAVIKINQLKEEREELRSKIDVQSEEIAKLKAKGREGERELLKTKDGIQLLQVDLQSSEKEKERLGAELQRLRSLTSSMEEVKREKQELLMRLSQIDTPHSSLHEDLQVQCQELSRQLQKAQAKLVAEKEDMQGIRRRAELLEAELEECKVRLQEVLTLYEIEKQAKDKLEMKLAEMNDVMADNQMTFEDKDDQIMLLKKEKDDLGRENQDLRDQMDGLRKAYAGVESEDASYTQPEVTPPPGDSSEHLYHNIENIREDQEQQEEAEEHGGSLPPPQRVCHHCQERFPGITQAELEQHQQSHRVCPFCTMICDHMEQAVFEDHVYGHEL
ncbi:calcium-binding and coiled-coil domain-containing protein 2 [Menidia menidia]